MINVKTLPIQKNAGLVVAFVQPIDTLACTMLYRVVCTKSYLNELNTSILIFLY